MTKKKKSNKGTRNPKPKPLEQFLKKGEPETYGQLCWSLANRATDKHQAGDVIKLPDWDKTGKQIEKRFRLTEVSIENIQRCQGIRTCGKHRPFSLNPHRLNLGENAPAAIKKQP